MVADKIEYIIMLIKLFAKHLRDNDIHNIMDYNDKVIYPDKIRSTCIISATILSSRTWR